MTKTAVTEAQRRLLDRLSRRDAFYITGADVRVARRLAALGLATLQDDGPGPQFKRSTNGDGERYSAVITDAGRAALGALVAS